MNKYKDIIWGKDLSLDEWLMQLFKDDSKVFPNNCFPGQIKQDEYIATIHKRSEKEVKDLLRKFLVHMGYYYGTDRFHLEYYQSIKNSKNEEEQRVYSIVSATEYYKRLIEDMPWEGLTWIIDLLPNNPYHALNVIDAFIVAHCQMLPDAVLSGLGDATVLIRSKFIDYEHPREIFLNLEPKKFEALVCLLYKRLGYNAKLTQDSHDGGIDVIAEYGEPAKKEKLLIQCKRYKNNVTVKEVRELLGVVSDNKATKGVLVCSSDITIEGKKLAKDNSRIELINYKQLTMLLNMHLGTNWPIYLDKMLIGIR